MGRGLTFVYIQYIHYMWNDMLSKCIKGHIYTIDIA